MNVRVKFSKYGFTKFLGHLDVVRYFQKAIRRSGLSVAYSEGFNPHPLLYFAAPLGLGETSDGEYMDMELTKDYPLGEIIQRLNAVMTEGFFVQRAAKLPDWHPNQKKESIMALTACADYMAAVKDLEVDGKPYAKYFSGFREKFSAFLGQTEIIVEKESKKSTKTVDIRPLIFGWGFSAADVWNGEGAPEDGICHAQTYGNGLQVFLKLANGSTDNLKPGLVMESFCKAYGVPYQESALQFHRMETYCDLRLRMPDRNEGEESVGLKDGTREFVPLWRL
ncbi:MAG: TIGR03936 family radical SAM-associated protein [Lachnospiraceae bacterium]|nr:TIGR03936 family radical SAM-associated protein [Lachnospiraceae bacterium]